MARKLGVSEEQIAIDPALDFDLTPSRTGDPAAPVELRAPALPLYVSLSRKDFIGAVWPVPGRRWLPPASASGGPSPR